MSESKTPRPDIVEVVRERYGRIATSGGGCCGPQTSCCDPILTTTSLATDLGYNPADLDLLPEGTNLGLGCGAPLTHLELQPGETVLDLGSGAGIDALLAGRQVGPMGRVIGVDMTPEMLAAARSNAAKAGMTHVDFREGRLEALPVDDTSIDAVTSNCVINLVPDKAVVFAEIARVLKPDGRLVVSDIVLDGELPGVVTENLMAWVGCISGAAPRETYLELLRDAGLGEVEILKDIDYLATALGQLPPDLAEALDSAGIPEADLEGVVRSITFRARKTITK
jgi:SAM-dependent methyltransferase